MHILTSNMKNLEAPSIWYITGSQDLYGESTLNQVAANSREILESLNGSQRLPLKLLFRPTLTRPEEVRALCLQANDDPNCAGLILWMHTFSPSKMWIGGLSALRKPFLHLHTQFNRDLPWSEIDMDFMNLNQSAHGDREAGFIHTRLRLNRKVVVGHWSDEEVQDRIAAWMRVSHMLEVCESIAAGRPSLEIHPLGIGGKEDPVRLVFNAHPGRAVNASLIDLGNRF